MFQGWDYIEEPKKVCDCHKPEFDQKGVCKKCGRPMPGITLSVQNASITMTNKFYLTGDKNHG